MMRGHRRWHVRIWVILGPLLAAGLGGALWLRATARSSQEGAAALRPPAARTAVENSP